MNVRTLTTLSALLLTVFAAQKASAEEAESQLAWQQPGYVMEVVVVTAPRPQVDRENDSSTHDLPLARLEPGYVEEVVVVTASRREVMAAAAPRLLAMLERRRFPGFPREQI